jgi:hypothetical protein
VYVTTRTHVGAVADGQIRSDGNHNPLLNLVHLPKNGWSQEEGIDWYEE